ncbi:glycosyltransferase [Shewanella avicenniae]|uniref:Glycosyltransferase n=1 Tax=Shewanella avicenniae TaxID=2814294 RepID=A0ABX7QML1_9GAMM|nr:glycosyltransferase [Shewanella avicenniae]QSX32682.1 glycosyltransferase [Shewanella avicenniae]
MFADFSQVVVLAFSDTDKCKICQDSQQKFVTLPKPSFLELFKNLFFKVLLERWSLNEALFYSYKAQRIINSHLNSDIDVVYVDSVRMATYLLVNGFSGAISVLDYDDIYSLRYENLYKSGGAVDVLGFYKSKLPRVVLYFIPLIIRAVLKFESARIRKRELFYASKFDGRVIVSPVESKMLSEMANLDVTDIAMSVPDYSRRVSRFSCLIENTDSKVSSVRVSLIGNFDYFPNQQSVDYIVNQIFPVFIQNGVVLTLDLIGRTSDDFKARYNLSNVNFLGFVDDLHEAVADSVCLLSPIVSGTGIKTKIVESFSLGLPVVTNQKGIEGLDVNNNRDILLAGTPEEYFEQVMRLANDLSFRDNISLNAYQYFSLNFRMEVIRSKWVSLIKNLEQR